MMGWLRLVLMIFYAPLRGMREARDRASLLPIAVIAFLSQAAYHIALRHFVGAEAARSGREIWGILFQASMIIVLFGVVLIPIMCLIANLFDRRGSFRVVLTQEYAPAASSVFYVFTIINIITIAVSAFFHYSGIQAAYVARTFQEMDQIRAMMPASLDASQLNSPVFISASLFRSLKLLLLPIGMVVAVKEVFRAPVLRSIAITLSTLTVAFVTGFIWQFLFLHIVGSPLLFFFVFMLLRGYFTDFMGQQRAKAAFKQNLESATLNPADASAHYNLGLIHQSRGELDQAVERFKRALEIDPEEIDASYQLGRIARSQKRYVDAIQNFEQVVTRNPAHSQHEIWREVAATYIAAGQYEDARTALEQFLEHRPSDPEGLYLMGRAHAGLGHRREATSLMQQCIEAVKSAPAYKYRTSKRWMNEAEQFIKSGQ